ncbi:MAG: hypothetical protein J1F14_08300 [Treponema sp.]|nr:hypothetical protein [Treponema sp.]
MKRKFVRALPLFAVVLGLVLAGCMLGPDENEGSGGTNLVEGEWKDGKISKDGQTKKYTFEVTKGTRYFIWLNDSDDGDGTKDADVGLKISHNNGTVICDSYGSASVLYTKPFTFSASSTGTVTITAAAHNGGGSLYGSWESGTGTFAIKYTSRPEFDEISEGEWKDDNIIATGQTNKYTFTASEKTRYFIYLDDTDAGSGITTKTADAGLKISHSDGTIICNDYGSASYLYSQPYTFISSNYGTITITTAAHNGDGSLYGSWETGTGTYAIRYIIADSESY